MSPHTFSSVFTRMDLSADCIYKQLQHAFCEAVSVLPHHQMPKAQRGFHPTRTISTDGAIIAGGVILY